MGVKNTKDLANYLFSSIQGKVLLVTFLVLFLIVAITFGMGPIVGGLSLLGIKSSYEPVYQMVLEIFTVIATISVVIIALFQESDKKAKLEIDSNLIVRENIPTILNKELLNGQVAQIKFDANYYKLKLTNVGSATAQNVYVKLAKISPIQKGEYFEGAQLSWSGPENYQPISLAKKDEAVFEIAYKIVSKPEIKYVGERKFDKDVTLQKVGLDLIWEKFAIKDWHLKIENRFDSNLTTLSQDNDFVLDLVVYSDNSEPVKQRIELSTAKMRLIQ